MIRATIASILLLTALPAVTDHNVAYSQDEDFAFQTVHEVQTTPVKDQARSGTCWSFASTSLLETELIRMGKDPLDLSEMYFVRMTYPQKVENYVRLHGNTTFGQGSLAGDIMRALRLYGIVPEAIYNGRRYGGDLHDHSELVSVLRGAVEAVVDSRRPSAVWPDAIDGVLDAYLGAVPERFEFEGRTYTAKSFAESLGLNPDDYVELTSFTHHPLYTWFALELPDNWARNKSYNVPLDELIGVMDHAIANGYSIAWDGDVSERSFCHGKGVAIWPAEDWQERSDEERDRLCDAPEPEVDVTQELRQLSFDNYTSSDDHLMHITGIARDQHGTKYYITKNSWGVTGAQDGYVYISEPYVRAKTMTVLLHKDALPGNLRRRIGI